MQHFGSTFSTPVRTWIENFKTNQILKGKFLRKIKNFWKICSQKTNFTVSFYNVKATMWELSCFLANLYSDNFLWKRVHLFNEIFRAASHSESSFWKTCEILNQDVWTCQILSHFFKIYHHFNWKFKNVPDNQVDWGNFSSKNQFLGSFKTLKRQKQRVRAPSKSMILRKHFLKKNHILNLLLLELFIFIQFSTKLRILNQKY